MEYSVSERVAAEGFQLPVPSGSRLRWLGRLLRNRSSLAGFAILMPLVVLAITAPYLPIADPLKPSIVASLKSPSLTHFFGTDKLGRDVFSRAVSGLQVSLLVGFSASAISLIAGIIIGTIAGLAGKAVDAAISAVVDVFLAFPSLLLAISIIAIFGHGIYQVILALAISGTPSSIRLQRVLTMGLHSRTYMDAARLASASGPWMLMRHILPNTLAPMLVFASIHAANAILAEAALSFLGLGITPPQPSLGNLVSDGRPYLQNAWWISTLPGLVVAVVSVSLHLISDGVREELDPRSGSHA